MPEIMYLKGKLLGESKQTNTKALDVSRCILPVYYFFSWKMLCERDYILKNDLLLAADGCCCEPQKAWEAAKTTRLLFNKL